MCFCAIPLEGFIIKEPDGRAEKNEPDHRPGISGCPSGNLVVLDGTTGQNAPAQARESGEVADLTGIILTKMDGTAKGGIAVVIQSELNMPGEIYRREGRIWKTCRIRSGAVCQCSCLM